MYPLLRKGDRLPSVAAVQILLNKAQDYGQTLAVDGIYGRNTKAAVKLFQARSRLASDGVVGKDTWAALNQSESLQVLDAVDITAKGDWEYEAQTLRSLAASPIVVGGMSNGVSQVMQEILKLSAARNVVLLRFHGHGAPGEMGISVGTGAQRESEFDFRRLNQLVSKVRVLSPIFCRYGSVELHGCRVGSGSRGTKLVSGLSTAWGVPVSAGLRTQYGGGSSTFRFEGPVKTAFPTGGSLRSWSASNSDAGRMSVMRTNMSSYAR